ncbi:peptidylprolyl isomerase [Fibrella sp. HMF5335]|uniref:Peptidylprolyl isomerase n=1 Tax=Fibrella rubiginis TaxID=2817060 RepID=A0A939K3S3_9BACT|nr:peptidylprolyl isomerase [Fibrella rubiginis]MBO0939562.1 peptidylprolyl isomerase [Fibrella rubiginis]
MYLPDGTIHEIDSSETIIDVGGNATLVLMYSRVTNNNVVYTDSTAILEIQSLYRMLKNGYNFHDLAVKYSQDPGSYKSGGTLKPSTTDDYVPEFRSAVLALTKDGISRPFKTDFGYHIVQLVGVKEGLYTARHILLRVD